MKIYKIPIVWQSIEYYDIEANNLQEAVTKALKIFLRRPDENYLDDSFEIDEILNENYPGEAYDENLAIKQIYFEKEA